MNNPPTDRPRALHFLEAADFVRDAHFRDGLSVQEISAALRHTADAADPMVGSLARDGFGLDEIAAMLAEPAVPAGLVAVPPTSTDRPGCSDPIECSHEAALGQARETNRRLNYEKQRLESELGTYRRAVRQWHVSERGTYISLGSLRAIGKAAGVDILGSRRGLKHFDRVEQAEAAIERVRALHQPDANGECQHCHHSSPCPTVQALGAADAVLAVLPAGSEDTTTTRADALTEAERTMLTYALDQAQEHIWSRDGFTDEDQAAVTSLRRLAAETQPSEPEAEPPPVGYSGKGRVWCLNCPRPDGEDVPVGVDLVEPYEQCAGCGRDVVDVAQAAAASAGVQTDTAPEPQRSRTARFLDALTHSGPGYDLTPDAAVQTEDPS